MYLEHFKLKQYPFVITPNVDFYCELPTHQEALNILLVSIEMHDGIIKITGEPGSGKTLLCQILLNRLNKEYTAISLPNPYLSHDDIIETILYELGLEDKKDMSKVQQHKEMEKLLLNLVKENKKVILLFDEAQGLSEETLESLRIISNLEHNSKKLLQMVLLGGSELNERLNQPKLRHFKQRISFSYELKAIEKNSIKDYVMHRLSKAATNKTQIELTKSAHDLLYNASKGSPRMINIICHKALMAAYGKGESHINFDSVKNAIDDTTSIAMKLKSKSKPLITGIVAAIITFSLFTLISHYM